MKEPFCNPIVTKHDTPEGGFYTTSLFWECLCEETYIHPHTLSECMACDRTRAEAPEVRLETVMHHSADLDSRLVDAMLDAADFPLPF